MGDILREATARWTGDLRTGSGQTTTGSGVLREVAYSVPSRFETGRGTNPEELIAAAHASCFSMMLAKLLGDAGQKPQEIRTRAVLTLASKEGGWKITRIHLATQATGPGLEPGALQRAAEQAKEQCPVSALLKPGLESLTFEAALG